MILRFKEINVSKPIKQEKKISKLEVENKHDTQVKSIIDDINSDILSKNNLGEFNPGDTIAVKIKVKEGNRERLQSFEGIVIAKSNRGINSSFTVRKISHGEGVERVFQSYSPLIDSVQLKRRGKVRRAKLYYMRELSGKAARIKEKLN